MKKSSVRSGVFCQLCGRLPPADHKGLSGSDRWFLSSDRVPLRPGLQKYGFSPSRLHPDLPSLRTDRFPFENRAPLPLCYRDTRPYRLRRNDRRLSHSPDPLQKRRYSHGSTSMPEPDPRSPRSRNVQSVRCTRPDSDGPERSVCD